MAEPTGIAVPPSLATPDRETARARSPLLNEGRLSTALVAADTREFDLTRVLSLREAILLPSPCAAPSNDLVRFICRFSL